ncbi:MAG TPA: hypothetical protein VIY10_16535 [Solirubrobacteraceae bacterium]
MPSRTAREGFGVAQKAPKSPLRNPALVTLVVVAVGLFGSPAFAAGASTTLTQLENSLAGSGAGAGAGHTVSSQASLRHIASLARKLRSEIAHPPARCKKGLAAAERLAVERRETWRLRRDIRAARAGIRTCKVPVTKPTPGSGSGTAPTGTSPTKPIPPTQPTPPTTVVPEAGLGTVNEIKIVSTWKFHGVGSEDFCWDMPPSQPGATKYWKLEQDGDLTFESDIHLDRTQAGTDSLDLTSGSSYAITPQSPCTDPGSYHLGGWTNGELNAALTINGTDGTGAVVLMVTQDVLDQDGNTVWSYGPGLPPSAADGSGADWVSQYTYPGLMTGRSEEIDWPAGVDGGSPSTTYTSLGVGGHVVAQLHETKSLDDAPSMTGTADILIELLSS